METFDPTWLEGHDFVFFKLHGHRGQPYWYGDDHITALSADQLLLADLQGAVVFVANCWLFDHDGTPGPMLLPLLRTASAVIGGPGTNYALANKLGGTDLLALYVRFFLRLRLSAQAALRLAKIRLTLNRPCYATKDTLGFHVFTPLYQDPLTRVAAQERTEYDPTADNCPLTTVVKPTDNCSLKTAVKRPT